MMKWGSFESSMLHVLFYVSAISWNGLSVETTEILSILDFPKKRNKICTTGFVHFIHLIEGFSFHSLLKPAGFSFIFISAIWPPFQAFICQNEMHKCCDVHRVVGWNKHGSNKNWARKASVRPFTYIYFSVDHVFLSGYLYALQSSHWLPIYLSSYCKYERNKSADARKIII